jgi:hypothetical protein
VFIFIKLANLSSPVLALFALFMLLWFGHNSFTATVTGMTVTAVHWQALLVPEMSVKLVVLDKLGTMVRFQADAIFFANCTDRLFSINKNSCSYFEIAHSSHFSQLLFFYQTN